MATSAATARHDDEERDTHERPSVRRVSASGIHVAVRIDAASEHDLWSDLTMDVGTGGVFVATYHRLLIGTIVNLIVTLGDDPTPLALTGVVRWTRPHRDGSDAVAGVGVRLVDPDPEAAAKLAAFARAVRQPLVFELDESPMRKRG